MTVDDTRWQLNQFFMLKQLRYVLFHCVFLYLLGESCMQMWDLMQAGKWHPRTAMVPSDESCGSKNWLHLCITYALMSGRVEQPKVIAGHVCYLWISRSLEPLVISLRHMFSWCKHIIPYHSSSLIISPLSFHIYIIIKIWLSIFIFFIFISSPGSDLDPWRPRIG